jgi:hypothetical protein
MRGAPVIDLQDDDACPVVKRDFIDSGEERWLDLVAAYVNKLFFDLFRVVQAFDPTLIVDAEDNCASARVCQSDYLGYYFVSIDKPDFELKVSVFSAANQTEQISSIQSARVAPGQFLFEQRALGVGDASRRSELSPACHDESSPCSDDGFLSGDEGKSLPATTAPAKAHFLGWANWYQTCGVASAN